MTDVLQRVLNVNRREIAPTCLAIGYFFFILFGYFLIRPVREALGVERGLSDLHWLFIATAFVMLPASIIYGFVAARAKRSVLVPSVYGFFLLNLVGFYLLRTLAPQAIGVASGRTFYVWLSVFNLFATSIFWQLMADSFTLEQAKRIFPMVAVGGTLGAIAGSSLAWQFAEKIGAEALMLLAIPTIACGVGCAMLMMRLAPSVSRSKGAATASFGAALRGARLLFRSPYLLGIGGYILILAIASTFLYFAQAEIVRGAAEETDDRTALFARIDLLAQIATLVLQLVVVGRLMRLLGVGIMLVILPVLAVTLLGAVAIWPTLLVITLAQAIFRAGKYAVARPSRETLFTVLTREEKYESKAVVDTFIYRAGDVVGASIDALMRLLGPGIVAVAIVMAPLGLAWGALGLLLGWRQHTLAREGQSPLESSANES